MRRRPLAQRDGNHAAVAEAFEAAGCSVVDTAAQGDGFPDMVVGCAGVNHLVEVKDPATRYGRAGLNDNQRAFEARWRGGRLWVVTSTDEALALVNNWRRALRR